MKIIITPWTKIDGAIVDVGCKAKTLQSKIHAVAISILSHWAITPKDGPEAAIKMTALMNASPYHAQAFANWVGLYSEMKWSEDLELWYIQEGQKFKKDALDNAKLQTFWEVSPPKNVKKPLTNESMIGMLQAILDKQASHTKKPVAEDNFSRAGNEAIRAAINALGPDAVAEEGQAAQQG